MSSFCGGGPSLFDSIWDSEINDFSQCFFHVILQSVIPAALVTISCPFLYVRANRVGEGGGGGTYADYQETPRGKYGVGWPGGMGTLSFLSLLMVVLCFLGFAAYWDTQAAIYPYTTTTLCLQMYMWLFCAILCRTHHRLSLSTPAPLYLLWAYVVIASGWGVRSALNSTHNTPVEPSTSTPWELILTIAQTIVAFACVLGAWRRDVSLKKQSLLFLPINRSAIGDPLLSGLGDIRSEGDISMQVHSTDGYEVDELWGGISHEDEDEEALTLTLLERWVRYWKEHNKLLARGREIIDENNKPAAEGNGKKPTAVNMSRFLSAIKRDAPFRFIAPAMICSVTLTVLGFVKPYLEGQLFDNVLQAKDEGSMDSLWNTLYWLIGIYLMVWLGNICAGILFALAAHYTTTILRKRLFSNIMAQDIGFFDQNRSGVLVSRLINDSASMQNIMTKSADELLQATLLLFGGVVTMFVSQWHLACISLATAPLTWVLVRRTGKIVRFYGVVQEDALADANAIATETIGNIRTVQSCCGEAREVRVFHKAVDHYLRVIKLTLYSETVLRFTRLFMSYATEYVILAYGMYLIVDGQMSIGQVVAFRAYLVNYRQGFENLIDLYLNLRNTLGTGHRYFEQLDRKPNIPRKGGIVPRDQPRKSLDSQNKSHVRTHRSSSLSSEMSLPALQEDGVVEISTSPPGPSTPASTVTATKGAVSSKSFSRSPRRRKVQSAHDRKDVNFHTSSGTLVFDSISFSYPSRPERQVLQDVTFEMRPGRVIALVGPSGAGKSTIVRLMERFHDPTEGKVTFDGHDYRDLNLHWLRGNIGYVEQEPAMFDRSVTENIAYGLDSYSIDDVTAAAKIANAHDFISELPEGYDTRCGERGVRLSGGQKQRIAIARAVVRNPPILILDEATSALDAENEHIVQEALERVMAHRATVVIAHRLSTIRRADVIFVLKEGRVIEKGSHDELLRIRGGTYASFIQHQLVQRQQQGGGDPLIPNSS